MSKSVPQVRAWYVTYHAQNRNDGRFSLKRRAVVLAPTRRLAMMNFRAGDIETSDPRAEKDGMERFCPIHSVGIVRGARVLTVEPTVNHVLGIDAESMARAAAPTSSGAPVPTSSGAAAPRPLYEIADEVRRAWRPIYFGAVPYVDAMSTLDGIGENYGADSADSIVRYFLANATTWRGDVARRVKAELKSLLASRRK